MVLRILRVPTSYDDAIKALVFGLAAVLSAVLVNLLGTLGVVFAPLLGYSVRKAVIVGLRVLHQTGRGERLLARFAILTSAVGVALFVGFLVNNAVIYLRSLQRQTMKGYGLQLTYPGSWQPIDTSQVQACKQTFGSCVLLVGQSDKTTLSIFQTSLPKPIQVDSALVRQHIQATIPNAHLTSQDTITVGGQPAGRVIYDGPYAAAPGEYGYFMSVEVANGLSLYSISAP